MGNTESQITKLNENYNTYTVQLMTQWRA